MHYSRCKRDSIVLRMSFIEKAVLRPGAWPGQEFSPYISAADHRRHDHLPIMAADTATGSCAGPALWRRRSRCRCTGSCCCPPPAGQGPATTSSLIQSTRIMWACHNKSVQEMIARERSKKSLLEASSCNTLLQFRCQLQFSV